MKRLPNHNPNCNNSIEWASDIEKQVEEKIIEISLNIDNIAQNSKLDMTDVLQKQIESLNTKLKRLYNLYAEGNDMIVETINDLENQKKEISEKLNLELEKKLNKNQKEKTIKKIKKIADIWDDIDKKSKNTILKSIIEKIIIDNGNIEIILKNF